MSQHVLVVSTRFPLPLKSGSQIRIYHTLAGLAREYDVTLVSLLLNGEGEDYIEEIEQLGVDVYPIHHGCSMRSGLARFAVSRTPYRVAKFNTPKLKHTVETLVSSHEFDLLWIHQLTTLALLPTALDPPVVIDQHNADLEYWETFRNGSFLQRVFARVNQRRLRRLQQQVVDRIDAILPVSEADATATRRWATDVPLWVTPNGVDTSKYSPELTDGSADSEVLFVGSLDRPRNQEAVDWFVTESWPEIYDRHDDAVFRIVGRNPSEKIERLASYPGVRVVGEVPEVIPHYRTAAVVVAPFVLGGGTKLKVLEALAMGKALVTTPKGAAGIDVVDGTHALLKERGPAFSDGVVRLLSDSNRRTELGRAGRVLVEERYSWDSILAEAVETIERELMMTENEA